jgi:hypothetical protein
MPNTAPINGTNVRFVVLRHEESEGAHYDLMIQTGEVLATWKCPNPPESVEMRGVGLRRIADHRLRYLEYEGPLSEGRGFVTRYDQGPCTLHERSDEYHYVTFQGRRLRGRFELRRGSADPQLWFLRALPA